MVWICMNRVRIDRRYEKDDKKSERDRGVIGKRLCILLTGASTDAIVKLLVG